MKKSKPYIQIERPNLVGKFAVMRQSSVNHVMKFTNLHEDVLSATEEAQRLTGIYPDALFLVMKVVTSVKY